LIYIGRTLSTSAPVVTGSNSAGDDLYWRFYEFKDVSTGTTLATVIENATAGSTVNEVGTSATASDASVQSLGSDRLALNFIAVNDDNAIATLAGMTGGTWMTPISHYADSAGTDGAIGIQTAYPGPSIPNEVGASLVNFGTTSNPERAQSFKALGDATKVRVHVSKSGGPEDNLEVTIQSDSSGSPSGTVLGTATLAGSDLTTTGTWYDLTLSADLTDGTTYWLVFGRDGANDNINYYRTYSVASSVRYADGNAAVFTSSWSNLSTEDIVFTVYPNHTTVDGGTASVTASDAWGVLGFALIGTTADGTTYDQALTGSLSFAGAFVKRDKKALTATLTPAGALRRDTFHRMTATLTPAGALTKKTFRSLAGVLSFSGALAASRLILKALTGTLSFSGSLSRRTGKSLAGTLSFAGEQSKRTAHTMTATLTPSGSLVKRTSRALAGALSFIGALSVSRLINVALSATLSFSGGLTKRTGKATAGTLSFAGSLAKRTSRALAGGLSFSGSLVKRTNRGLAGGLSFVGSLARRTGKATSGTLSFSGSVAKRTSRALAGALSWVGGLATNLIPGGGGPQTYFQELTATLSFTGNLNRRMFRQLSGGLSFIGTLTKRNFRSFTATLSFVGAFRKTARKNLTATLSFTGAISRRTFHMMTATLSFVGSLPRRTVHGMTATLSFSGSLTKNTARTLAGVLSFVGNHAMLQGHFYTQAFTATLSFSGSLARSFLTLVFGGDALTRMKSNVSRFPWYARGNRRGRR